MGKKHLIIMDPLSQLNLKLDSSLRMAFEICKLDQEVYFCEPIDIQQEIGSKPYAHCQKLAFAGVPESAKAKASEIFELNQFTTILMRKDPPYDLNYITTTWLLDAVMEEVKVINSPVALRKYNEKLALFYFPEACRAGLVSSNAEKILSFIRHQGDDDVVIKPLHLFGGKGIERLSLSEMSQDEALTKLDQITHQGQEWRLVQAFDENIHNGEVRAFTAFGKPLSWCLKKPKKGEYLANTSAGATLEAYTPKPGELEKVNNIAAALKKEGVEFIGFDLIGGYVSEINITSPRLLTAPGDDREYYKEMAEVLAEF